MKSDMGGALSDSSRIAAVVVLYRPGSDVLDGILSYLHQVDVVYAVDNSEESDARVVARLAEQVKVIYLPNNDNLGIARGLNIGAQRALDEGYQLLLTMDQDSKAAPDMVARIFDCMNGVKSGRVGIVAPFHLTRAGRTPPDMICSDVMTPMTSGCLLNLSAYRETGPFADELFIDFVDNEYCLRLRKHGWQVLRANRATLEHNVGDICKFGPFIATNHGPLRRYYKTRNRFWVFREYVRDFPGHCLFDLVRLMKEIASIVLFENEKLSKLAMMWRGFRDFLQGVRGRYAE
jgi:rhamnosyltransferase